MFRPLSRDFAGVFFENKQERERLPLPMAKMIRSVWNAVTLILTVAVLLLAALLWGYRLLGLQAFAVQSGSMEPACPVGSLVYVRSVEVAELKTGDIITFKLSDGVRCTHRIIEVTTHEGSPAFVTKGDANEEADGGFVLSTSVIGRVEFIAPYMGFVAAFLQQPSGAYIKYAVVAGVLLLIILPDVFFPEKKKPEQQET